MKFNDWLGLLSLIISLVIIWQFRQILLLVFTAIVLATALNGLVRWLMRKLKLSRGRSILVTVVGVLLTSMLFILFIIPPFVGQFLELIQLIPVGLQKLVVWVNNLIKYPPLWFPESNLDLLPNFSEIYQQLGSLATKVFNNFFTFFSFRGRAQEIINKNEVGLLAWLKGVSINSIFVAILSGFGLLLLGIPFVFTHALIAGVFNFVPNIGPILSVVFPLAVALLNSPGKAIAVVVWYVIVQNLESYWFSPLVMKKQVNLLPGATLIAQMFFTTFLGFLGLVLALPLAVVAKIWIEEALIKDFLNNN